MRGTKHKSHEFLSGGKIRMIQALGCIAWTPLHLVHCNVAVVYTAIILTEFLSLLYNFWKNFLIIKIDFESKLTVVPR